MISKVVSHLLNEVEKKHVLGFNQTFKVFRKLSKKEKVQLVHVVKKRFLKIPIEKNLNSRISMIVILVSLIPESIQLIIELINRKSMAIDYEIHFTLFCYLDKIFYFPEGEKAASILLDLVEDYLMHVKKVTARAAWMAGDLLGDHWPLQISLPVLMRTAEKARYVAGRKGAIHGLEHALENLRGNPKKEVIDFLKKVSYSDRSGEIQFYLKSIVKEQKQK